MKAAQLGPRAEVKRALQALHSNSQEPNWEMQLPARTPSIVTELDDKTLKLMEGDLAGIFATEAKMPRVIVPVSDNLTTSDGKDLSALSFCMVQIEGLSF